MSHQNPTIDKHNPLYCPNVSPSSYLATLRKSLSKPQVLQDSDNLFSFARNMDHTFLNHEDSSTCHDEAAGRNQKAIIRQPSSPDALPPYSPPRWKQRHLPPYLANERLHTLSFGGPSLLVKRKRSFNSITTFSDLEGPTKRERSFESIHDSSFSLSGQGERLFLSSHQDVTSPYAVKQEGAVFSNPQATGYAIESELLSRIRILEDELYGPRLGTETPGGLRQLIDTLDRILPGTRVKNRFSTLENLTHQDIADVLGDNGYLTASVLNALRTSEIKSLSLSSSISDADGLNLAGRDIFSVFSKPNSFLFISELIFSGTPIHDFDLIHIHHLPRLARLALDDTEIGNEAMFLLVPLKRSLLDLTVAGNPRIDDNAIPPIMSLNRISYLSIVDTAIGMEGLRMLARTIHSEDRAIEIAIPVLCEFYIDNMDSKYMIEPKAPLIVDPTACAALSVAALKRNLSGHAAFNPDIVSSGTKLELVERLKKILETRQIDMVIRDMLWGA
ncbi:hypothetical protein HWV62_14438 [Athelia sp. TMB]|nr:hypothetical protein HWV62_40925 [Athelia sp. TMB]KAF7984400.1 hypothetical protein HWV62_14438 [Athelia sp. TMB]